MTTINTDICVIGAGSGGLSVAAGAVQMGASVVLIEKGEMGGDCLNTGCVPSKALLHASARGLDWDAAHDHVRDTIAGIAPHDSQERFEGLGCTVIRDHARFTGPREVVAGDTTVRAKRFVIATGSRAFVPDVPGLEGVAYLTNETIFDLAERPEHLLITGGGPIGLEMALAHHRLGCAVTVVEGAKAMGRDDPEAAALVLDDLRARGITLYEDAPMVRARAKGDGVEVVTQDGTTLTGSHLLVAVGRKANIDDMGLEAAGVETDGRAITVNQRLRTSNRRIYAIGDVTGGAQFTHVAGYQAGVVIRPTVLRLPAKARTDHIPWVTYTDPELAQVGMTEAQARDTHGDDLTVLSAEMADNDRARAAGEQRGFLKVMVVKGRPIGATLVAKDAGELIAPWSLAISKGLKLSDISGMILPYPTRSEIHKRAAGSYFTPKLFENDRLKRIVRIIQTLIP